MIQKRLECSREEFLKNMVAKKVSVGDLTSRIASYVKSGKLQIVCNLFQ